MYTSNNDRQIRHGRTPARKVGDSTLAAPRQLAQTAGMTREQIETGLYRYAHRLVTRDIRSLPVRKQVSVSVRDAERLSGQMFSSTLSHLRIVSVNVDEVIRLAACQAIEDHLTGFGLRPRTLATSAASQPGREARHALVTARAA